ELHLGQRRPVCAVAVNLVVLVREYRAARYAGAIAGNGRVAEQDGGAGGADAGAVQARIRAIDYGAHASAAADELEADAIRVRPHVSDICQYRANGCRNPDADTRVILDFAIAHGDLARGGQRDVDSVLGEAKDIAVLDDQRFAGEK